MGISHVKSEAPALLQEVSRQTSEMVEHMGWPWMASSFKFLRNFYEIRQVFPIYPSVKMKTKGKGRVN